MLLELVNFFLRVNSCALWVVFSNCFINWWLLILLFYCEAWLAGKKPFKC